MDINNSSESINYANLEALKGQFYTAKFFFIVEILYNRRYNFIFTPSNYKFVIYAFGPY